ncbi:hypothetical protein PL78_04075 [Yersinia entomophaga]|uniref:Uncharacterized protein n=1 Tax=Yersinia entomophaga TaxID=935293 RepID=A0ABM6BI40_YERET|nr:hypothetical protein [Yersinia entomophaga]ANI29016.1 hypothetical protein PL78_04075 [Yersinia entomophaga]OWF88761.1 hypothetical protein B4914_05985 [Yersinia entomophaga]
MEITTRLIGVSSLKIGKPRAGLLLGLILLVGCTSQQQPPMEQQSEKYQYRVGHEVRSLVSFDGEQNYD